MIHLTDDERAAFLEAPENTTVNFRGTVLLAHKDYTHDSEWCLAPAICTGCYFYTGDDVDICSTFGDRKPCPCYRPGTPYHMKFVEPSGILGD